MCKTWFQSGSCHGLTLGFLPLGDSSVFSVSSAITISHRIMEFEGVGIDRKDPLMWESRDSL